MIVIRERDDRGKSDFGWLDSRHTFSFGGYHDPAHPGFRVLRVLNEDRVAPGAGFGTHPHRDMEILSWVVEGAMEHRDSTGTGSVIRPGEIQRMSAGTGITHSEYNASETDALHFLQMWILPERRGLEPSYEQKSFPLEEERGRLVLLASQDGRDGSVRVHQDVALFAARLATGNRVEHPIAPGRHAWLQVVRGRVTAGERPLEAGDGASVSEEPGLALEAATEAEVLVFDLP
jgi:redox-sensitive bicupin YhaK (pirin superfamily)